MKRLAILTCWLLGVGHLAFAGTPDSTQTELPWRTYLEQVYRHHPVMKQLQLTPEMAEAVLMMARGAFDPKIKSSFRAKEFKDTDYFQLWDSKLEVPVWNFAELKAGYERNNGVYLNPEANVPTEGLWYAGVSVPIGKGMFIDSRRAAVKMALLDLESTEANRQKNANKFLLMAAKAYWEWNQAFQLNELREEAVVLARFRRDGTLQRIVQGDAAPIDTLEATLQLQSRQLDQQQSVLDLQTAKLYLETFLWDNQGEPLQLTAGVRPQELVTGLVFPEPMLPDSLLIFLETHPEILKYTIKGEQLKVERRLAIENLKPELNLEYNWLWAPGADLGGAFSNFQNDYKWGGTFSIPIFLRKERGKLTQVRIKQEQNAFGLQQAYLALENQIRQGYVSWQQYQGMHEQAVQMAAQYAQLLAAERTRFDNGESSLFLVNSRELKYLEARAKRIELEAKLGKAQTEVWQQAGILEAIWLTAME